jgi:hypothetical protein
MNRTIIINLDIEDICSDDQIKFKFKKAIEGIFFIAEVKSVKFLEEYTMPKIDEKEN